MNNDDLNDVNSAFDEAEPDEMPEPQNPKTPI
jgi:hypothetical protein